MTLFPAIDILENRAVRLLRGRRSEVTDYGDPVERAKMWIDQGAEWLHVVDLGGAFDGVSHISDIVYHIAKLGVPVQCGGGLRTMEDIGNRFAAGASRVVLGTVCYTNFALFLQAVEKYGSRIVAGIDAQNGMLAVNGWTETVDMSAMTFAKRAKQTGVRYAVFTDIARDGAMTGVAAEETQAIAQESGLRIIASGGIASLDDLKKLKDSGIYGAILGRSIYEGAIDLKTAIEAVRDAL